MWIWCSNQEPFHMLLPLLHHMAPLDLNVTKTIIEEWNRSAANLNFIESYAVQFDINEPLNLTEIVLLTGMDGMVSCAHLCYALDYLTPGICSLVKFAAMEKLM